MATRSETSLDPLDLGERIIAILQQGQKLSTYKLATLSALVEYCLAENELQPFRRSRAPKWLQAD